MIEAKVQVNNLYTIEGVATEFNVSSRTVYRWLSDGKLSGQKIGRSWRISQESINNLTKTRTREAQAEDTKKFIGKGHYVVLAPERDALSGTVLKLIKLGLQHEYNVFCSCWTQTIEEQYDLARKMSIPLDIFEQQGRFFSVDFAQEFDELYTQGILDKWQNWAEASNQSTRPIMGIGTPNIHSWGEHPQDLIDFEAALDELWQPIQAISFCVYSLADFIPEGLQRLGSLISHHDGLIMWGENGSIVLERGISLFSIFDS